MNDEIKEILEQLEWYRKIGKKDVYYPECVLPNKKAFILLDYITNLQQENEELKKKLDRRYYKNEYERIKKENDRLKENNSNMQEEMARVWEENERLKDIVVEKDNQIKEMIIQKTDYTAVNILEMKLEDYKSRCEKAIEELKSWQLDCNYSKENEIYQYIINILQNGSDSQ